MGSKYGAKPLLWVTEQQEIIRRISGEVDKAGEVKCCCSSIMDIVTVFVDRMRKSGSSNDAVSHFDFFGRAVVSGCRRIAVAVGSVRREAAKSK